MHAERIDVRVRRDDDLDGCIALAAAVHELDGYPPYLPNGDYRTLLTRPPALVSYVAIDRDGIVGHVALHAARPGAAVTLASEALGCEAVELGVVARLFAAPTRRRAGAGRALLDAVTAGARERGLLPMLDVWVELRGAVGFYEACGWTRLGTVDVLLPDGRVLPEHVLAAP